MILVLYPVGYLGKCCSKREQIHRDDSVKATSHRRGRSTERDVVDRAGPDVGVAVGNKFYSFPV